MAGPPAVVAITVVRAVVREWHEDEGWGVIDSVETPGGCWALFTAIESPIIESSEGMTVSEYKVVVAGDAVDLIWEQPGQDGFDFRAVTVRKYHNDDYPVIDGGVTLDFGGYR